MKRFKIVGLCLIAVFALTAVFAGSASAAAPEYFTCLKATTKNKGNYSDKECFTPATATPEVKESGTGKYERGAWNAGKKTTFKGKGKNPKNNNVNPLGECIKPSEAEKAEKEKELGKEVPCETYSQGKGKIEGTTECKTEKLEGEITGPKTIEVENDLQELRSQQKQVPDQRRQVRRNQNRNA